MASLAQQHYHQHGHTNLLINAWKGFISWCNKQEEYKLGWLAFILIGHACVFTNVTAGIILVTGNHFIFWPVVIAVMMVCLVINLLGMPTRITIPVFAFSLLADLSIIILCLLHGVDVANIYP